MKRQISLTNLQLTKVKPHVYAKIPKTGMANCLFVWAHAMVFAKEHNLPLIVGRWSRYRWGAIIRREKKNRRYKGYFRETSPIRLFFYRIRLVLARKVYDPKIDGEVLPNTQYIYTQSNQHRDLFRYLRPHIDLIRTELFNLLTPQIQEQFRDIKPPEIGIHIRRGDFKNGNPVTPLSFFIFVINSLRNARGKTMKVTVFTDAAGDEIKEILDLPNVSLSENKEDILDLLQLSQSRFMILSRSSTFSYWAAFLSNAVVYMDAHDWQEKIKDKDMYYREARIDLDRVK